MEFSKLAGQLKSYARTHPFLSAWVLCGVVVGIDFLSGPGLYLAPLSIFPIALLAWYRPVAFALPMVVVLAAVPLSYHYVWTVKFGSNSLLSFSNACIRMVTFFLFAWLFSYLSHKERQVQTLTELLPICGFCKKIRKPDNQWQDIEQYLAVKRDIGFTHSFCPDCGKKHYGAYYTETEQTN